MAPSLLQKELPSLYHKGESYGDTAVNHCDDDIFHNCQISLSLIRVWGFRDLGLRVLACIPRTSNIFRIPKQKPSTNIVGFGFRRVGVQGCKALGLAPCVKITL